MGWLVKRCLIHIVLLKLILAWYQRFSEYWVLFQWWIQKSNQKKIHRIRRNHGPDIWIAYIRSNRVLHCKCFRLKPNRWKKYAGRSFQSDFQIKAIQWVQLLGIFFLSSNSYCTQVTSRNLTLLLGLKKLLFSENSSDFSCLLSAAASP